MRRQLRSTAIVIIFLLSLIATMPTQVAASDGYVDYCNEAPVLTPGEHSGTIDTPKDIDAFKIRLSEGDKLTMNMYVGNYSDRFKFTTSLENGTGDKQSFINFSNVEFSQTYNNYDDMYLYPKKDSRASVEVIAEQSGLVCYKASEVGAWQTPYNWQIGFSINEPTAPSPPIAELRNEMEELQNKLNQKNRTITQLETKNDNLQSRIKQKNQTISELENELKNTKKPIEVTVKPTGGAEEFQVGGKAVVTAGSASFVPSELTVSYLDTTENVGEDGRVRVPLAQSGNHQMTFNYLDSETSVTLSVTDQQQPSESTAQSDTTDETAAEKHSQDSDETVGESGPGFGAGIAVTAVLSVALLLKDKTG